MGLKPTPTNAKVLVDLLMEEHEDVEELALAVMTKSFEVYEARAKFAVVGQSAKVDDFQGVPANGVCLGAYATKKQAEDAAESLTYSTANPSEPMHVWVLPIYNGSPHQYHAARKVARAEADLGVTQTDRFLATYRAAPPGSPPCGRVLDVDEETLEFVHCALFRYHPGTCKPLAEAELERCDSNVLIPGDEMRKCDNHKYHPGPCSVRVTITTEEESHDPDDSTGQGTNEPVEQP